MSTTMLDALIVGAGPAGCSAAAWLAMLGLRAVTIEREAEPCAGLTRLREVDRSWVLGALDSELAELGRRYARDIAALPGVDLRLGHALQAVDRIGGDGGGWRVQAGGVRFDARCLVIATGTCPRRPAAYFAGAGAALLDAITLTEARRRLPPADTLLLGGGDNAVENACYLAERGHRVTLWSRSALRAQPALMERLARWRERIVLREGEPMPELVAAGDDRVQVRSPAHGRETYRAAAVLFGFEPRTAAYRMACDALARDGSGAPAASHALAECPAAALFVAGDAAGRWHPCVQTALADGVGAAKAVQRHVLAAVANDREASPPR